MQQLTGILTHAPFCAHCKALSGVLLVWQSVLLCHPWTPWTIGQRRSSAVNCIRKSLQKVERQPGLVQTSWKIPIVIKDVVWNKLPRYLTYFWRHLPKLGIKSLTQAARIRLFSPGEECADPPLPVAAVPFPPTNVLGMAKTFAHRGNSASPKRNSALHSSSARP